MSQRSFFASAKNVYWPSEFADVVNVLKGLDESGSPIHAGMYRFNTGAMVLAAVIGLCKRREREVGPIRNEISTETFETHKLAAYLLLIPLLARQDTELLHPNRDEEALRTFERYAAGGFEYLRGELANSVDPTGQTTITELVRSALAPSPTAPSTLVDILA